MMCKLVQLWKNLVGSLNHKLLNYFLQGHVEIQRKQVKVAPPLYTIVSPFLLIS